MKMSEFYEPFLQYLRDSGKAEGTVKNYGQHVYGSLSHSVQDTELKDLRLTDCAKVAAAGRTHGKYGEELAMIVYRMLMKFIYDSGYKIPFDWRDVKPKKAPRPPVEYLTKEELERFRSVIDTSKITGLRMRAFFELMLHSGMRTSEATNLLKSNVNWDLNEIKITNSKTFEPEKVYMTSISKLWLKKYLDARTDNSPHLFVSRDGKPLLPVTARAALTKYEKLSGIQKEICHRLLRKTFVTILAEKASDVKSVQYLARHKSVQMTLNHYTAVRKERAKEVHVAIMENI